MNHSAMPAHFVAKAQDSVFALDRTGEERGLVGIARLQVPARMGELRTSRKRVRFVPVHPPNTVH